LLLRINLQERTFGQLLRNQQTAEAAIPLRQHWLFDLMSFAAIHPGHPAAARSQAAPATRRAAQNAPKLLVREYFSAAPCGFSKELTWQYVARTT